MKQKNSKKAIKRNALRHAGRSRNYVRRSLSRKAISFTGTAGAGSKILAENKRHLKLSGIPINKSGTLKRDHLKLVPKASASTVEQKPLTEKPATEKPLNAYDSTDSAGGRRGGGSGWNNPRTSGLIAAALLLVMLVTAVWSANANDNANSEPAELASAQTGSLKLAKEYIYAGSRMLAIEDYGLSGTPTATPTPATPTPTPSTPTPTPVIASCPTGYSSLGGLITANPTATVFNNSLFVFVRGGGNDIYYRKTVDGSNYDNYVALGGYLISDPATLVTYNALYVEATGGDNNRYYRSTNDGANFAAWAGGTVGAQTTASAYFNGNTYTFVKGDGTEPPLCVNVTAGGTPTPVPPTPTPTPNPTPTPLPLPTSGNYYQIVSKLSNKCVDVTGGNSAFSDGLPIKQWDCGGASSANQLWQFVQVGDAYQVISYLSNKCVDVAGFSYSDTAGIQQYGCLGSSQTNQLWKLVQVGDAFQLVAKHSDKCLDVAGGGGAVNNGDPLQQYSCFGSSATNQLWTLNPVTPSGPPPTPEPTPEPCQPDPNDVWQCQYYGGTWDYNSCSCSYSRK